MEAARSIRSAAVRMHNNCPWCSIMMIANPPFSADLPAGHALQRALWAYFLLTGSLSLIYYLAMWFYSKKWNSTFVLFWPALGGAHLILGILLGFRPLPIVVTRVLCGILIGSWAVFLGIEVQICIAMKKKAERHLAYLIILGAQVRGTRITSSLKKRLDAALRYLEENPETQVIVAGGQGRVEDISEAEAMAGYLREHGIEETRIYLEDASTTTWENLKFSAEMIKDLSMPLAVVTNNFHLYRAMKIGKQVGYQNLQGIPASSNSLFQVNYLVREFFGVLKFLVFKR
ncbi:MAG: YdcF family protein [Lachnospiraceae bacterium]|nr:YdcF family protein [Lachnospiraceae bacterium]